MRLFFDMDGVLAKYDKNSYKGKNPEWLQDGYFKGLAPDKSMVRFFNKCAKLYKTATLTTIFPKGNCKNIQVKDKSSWVKNYLSNAALFKYTITGVRKSATAEKLLGRKLCKTDILVDDYNPNLIEWEQAGGTGVKYLNSLNSADSWGKACLSPDMSVKDKLNVLKNIAA